MPLKFWHSCWIQWLGNQLFFNEMMHFLYVVNERNVNISTLVLAPFKNIDQGNLRAERAKFTHLVGIARVSWEFLVEFFCSFFMRSNMKHTNHICKCATCGYVSFPPPLNNTSQNARLHALKSLENMTQRRHRVLGKKSGERRLHCHYTRDSSTETSLSHFSPLIAAKFWRTHKKFPKSRREINWVF